MPKDVPNMTPSYNSPSRMIEQPIVVGPKDWDEREFYLMMTALVIPRPLGWIPTLSSDSASNRVTPLTLHHASGRLISNHSVASSVTDGLNPKLEEFQGLRSSTLETKNMPNMPPAPKELARNLPIETGPMTLATSNTARPDDVTDGRMCGAGP